MARELIGMTIRPQLYGCTSDSPVHLEQGAKQGAPESGLLFIATMNNALQPIQEQWQAQDYGMMLDGYRLTHMLFVDDLMLIGPSPQQVSHMLTQVKPALKSIGLHLNEDKTDFVRFGVFANQTKSARPLRADPFWEFPAVAFKTYNA